MLILGIESSCDDAAAAVIETATAGIATIRSSTVANQDDIHRAYGGIVPELASRNHVVTILPVIERALGAAGCRLADIEGIAVTRGPGLVGSLLVGLMCAKGLAQSVGLPMVGVNHIEGHLLAPMLEHRVAFPYLALVVSGGHTALFAVEDFGRYRRLGQTRDDAAGEAFDKVAKLMGLGYPGGKVIDDLSKQGNRKRVKIPRAHVRGAPLDFSFSGVKTAVATILAERGGAPLRRAHPASNNFAVRSLPIARSLPIKGLAQNLAHDLTVEDLAASFQEAVVDMLVAPTIAAARELAADTVVLTGGVAANSRLRERLAEALAADGRALVAPSLKYCTDNAAMIALAGSYRLLRGERDDLSIDAAASLPL
jgi:N6-L-threonylcarbamoyladenine synthase